MAYSVQEVHIKTSDGFKKMDSTNLLTKTSEGWSESNAQELLNSNSVINLVEHNPINAKLIDDTLYRQVDYITTSGTQYFKTGVTSAVNSGFDIDFIMLNGYTSSPYYNLFGSRGTGTVGELRIDTIPRGDGTELKLGSNVYSSGIKGAYRNRIKLYNGVYTKPDGTQLTNLDASTIANYPREIYIGCINKDNSAYGNKASLQIFHWVMYTGTTLERDFWPVMRIADSVYGLYDVAHGVFYEPQGAAVTANGENIIPYNQDTLTESEKIISGLPNTYRPLEYLESTGKQYIDTGVVATNGFELEIKIDMKSGTKNGNIPILSAHEPSSPYKRNYIYYIPSNKKIEMAAGDKISRTNITLTGNDVIKASNVNGNFYLNVNGINYTPTITSNSSDITCSGRTLHLLHSNGYDLGYAVAKVYYCKITVDGTLVRDLVPAARIDTNQFGLFDLVSQSFFINAGTHEFIAGPTLLPVMNQEPSINQNYKQLNSIYLSSKDYITILPDTAMPGYTCYLEFGLDSNTSFEGYIFGSKSCRLYLRTDVSNSLAYISIDKDTTNYTINLNGSFTRVKIICDATAYTETLYVYTGEGDTGWYKVHESLPEVPSNTAPNGFVLGGYVNGNSIVNTNAPIYISSCDIYEVDTTSGNINTQTMYIGRPVLEQRTGITGLYNEIDGSIATSKGVTGEGKCWHYPIQLVSNAVIGTLPLGTLIRVADSDGGNGAANYEIADINNLVPGGVVLVRKNIYSNSAFGSNTNYPNGTLDNLIKTTIYNKMPQQLRDKMMDVTFNLSGSGDITRKMFALTYTMAGFGNNNGVAEGKALQLYTSNASRVKTLNGSAASWWLSSQNSSGYVWFVYADGSVNDDLSPSFLFGVVPAFVIPSDTPYNATPNTDGSYELLPGNIPTISTKFIDSNDLLAWDLNINK